MMAMLLTPIGICYFTLTISAIDAIAFAGIAYKYRPMRTFHIAASILFAACTAVVAYIIANI